MTELQTIPLRELFARLLTDRHRQLVVNEFARRYNENLAFRRFVDTFEIVPWGLMGQKPEPPVQKPEPPVWPSINAEEAYVNAQSILDSGWNYKWPGLRRSDDNVKDFLRSIVEYRKTKEQLSDGERSFYKSICEFYSQARKDALQLV